MPRNKEPSFEVKLIIWEKAATTGNKPWVIQRELENELHKLEKEQDQYEDTPDVRTIKRIIEKDIDELSQEVVIAKLEPHIWPLRNDYEEIKSLADSKLRGSALPKELVTTALIIASNLEKIRNAPLKSSGDPLGRTWLFTVGEEVYGGWWIYEDIHGKLGDVDEVLALQLLQILKDQAGFPELMQIDDWADLKEDDNTEEFIQRLISWAHRR